MSRQAHQQRYVPQGQASLLEDAPGWGQLEKEGGPICWKCKGTTLVKRKNSASSSCPVCQGLGRLPPKRQQVLGATQVGVITRERQHPSGWKPSGPVPYALSNNQEKKWIDLVAQTKHGDVEIPIHTDDDNNIPGWIPRCGEQLCNLVGSWRILQRVHRWTTDDLVTATVAAQDIPSNDDINYLDLGTGNASVLQMVLWALLGKGLCVKATGVEARSEAVHLARRSLSYNVGNNTTNVSIVHGDFRDFMPTESFDLITGTPPYFSVNFTVSNDKIVTEAVIQQGGMPTARQSAPARCEFRGGIEAYCEVASRLLREKVGRLVVCENWLNHDRVVKSAAQTGLQIIKQVQVIGREGKPTLFCVYVMKKKKTKVENNNITVERERLVVRDRNGQWTQGYQRTVLDSMSIPYPPPTCARFCTP